MRKSLLFCSVLLLSYCCIAQNTDKMNALNQTTASTKEQVVMPSSFGDLTVEKLNATTPIKNQGQNGTCWSFSGISLIETQFLKTSNTSIDLSEMYIVRCIYYEKAKNYFLRQGKTQFSEGALGHDVLNAIEKYGVVPENAFSKASPEMAMSHSLLVSTIKSFLDTLIAKNLKGDHSDSWQNTVNKYLNTYLGTMSEVFKFNGKQYSPTSFAKDVLNFNASDYIAITSFADHEYYAPFVLNVPDNFSNGSYYNIPLTEMINLTKSAIKSGYTVLWDGDISNNGFLPKFGAAVNIREGSKVSENTPPLNQNEMKYNPELRQQLYENLTTQDDHLMHIIGIEKNSDGKTFFIFKNSWGTDIGPYKGFINVSEAYFALNTVSLIFPKSALPKTLIDKLKITSIN